MSFVQCVTPHASRVRMPRSDRCCATRSSGASASALEATKNPAMKTKRLMDASIMQWTVRVALAKSERNRGTRFAKHPRTGGRHFVMRIAITAAAASTILIVPAIAFGAEGDASIWNIDGCAGVLAQVVDSETGNP